jgi:NADH:ubiquinone oxidoreductase subunit 6 (subunit J)
VAIAAALAFFALLASLIRKAGEPDLAPLTEDFVGIKSLARTLFSDYLLPFEIVGLLLLVAVIGATVVARRPSAEEIAAGEGPTPTLLPGEEAEP